MKLIILVFLLLTACNGANTSTGKGGSGISMSPEKTSKIGMEQFEKGQYTDALNTFLSDIKSGNDSSDNYNNAGMCYLKLGNSDTAEVYFRKAAERDKKSLYYTNLGLALQSQTKLEQAFEAFQEAGKIDPKNDQAFVYTGNLMFLTGNMEQAKKYWKLAMSIKPDAEVLSNMGAIYLQENNYIESERLFLDALKLSPENYLAYFNLGVIRQRQKQHEAALDYYTKCLEKNADYYPAIFNRGIVYETENRKKEAIGEFELFIAKAPAEMKQQITDAREKIKKLKK